MINQKDNPATTPDTDSTSSQEQSAYEKVVLSGMKIMYDNATHNGIMQMLTSGKADPAKAMANTVSMIIIQLDKKSGGKIPGVVILPAATELLGEVAQLAGKSKLFQVDERIANQAMQQLLMSLAQEYGMPPETIKSILQSTPKDQIQQIVTQQSQFAAPNQTAQPSQPAAQPQVGA